MEKTSQLGIRINTDLLNKYIKRSKELGLSHSELMRFVLARYMDNGDGKDGKRRDS